MARFRILVWAALIAAVTAVKSQAQSSLLLQGIVDGEFWSTTGRSDLLTRNGGRPAALARVNLWGAYEPVDGLVFYAQGVAEHGNAREQTDRYDFSSEQFGARYIVSSALTFEVGQLTPVIGEFTSRRFSTRNPLIGVPDGYTLEYPLGTEIFGATTHFDYRAALVSLPASHIDYVPSPTPRYRPAIGGGITPFVGFHLGASATAGPYLNDSFKPAALAGKRWFDFDQRVLAFDMQYARGYLETHAEMARGAYDVPGFANEIVGYTYYGEAKYTFTPRFFLAARIERNDYPFIHLSTPVQWTGKLIDFVDGEFGAGYRLTSSTLLKVSLRGDRWWVNPAAGFRGKGGPAVAMQLSQAFDAMNWFARDR